MSPTALASSVKQRARAEGFDFVAVAAAGRLDRDGVALRAWLTRDFQAAMVWMNRDPQKRADPARLLPGCRSVIALAMTYWPGRERAAGRGGGRVALYARGRDYHKILGKRARALAAWLVEQTGASARAFVDTGPVLERAWAERAGLGWIGKNANLIRRDAGSWLLLAEVLSAAEIEPDPGPHEDSCGSCNACIEACPTGAIVEPGVVDSNRCISNWTIEHRGPIPVERRDGIADWIFGCDVCQDVCPWNVRFAREVDGDPFGFRDDLRGLDPRQILALDEASFRERYSGTSLMRAKWEGLRRNACVVLGNSGDREAVPSLSAALRDRDPVVRGHAAWALGRLGGKAALDAVAAALEREPDPAVRDEIARVLDSRAD